MMLGLPFLLAAGFLAQLVAALFRRGEVVQVVLLALGMPFFFLSGFAWPVEAIPAHLNALAQLIPSTAAIDGLVRSCRWARPCPRSRPSCGICGPWPRGWASWCWRSRRSARHGQQRQIEDRRPHQTAQPGEEGRRHRAIGHQPLVGRGQPPATPLVVPISPP